MNTHLIMYANVQDSARRSTETWHYPRTRGPRRSSRVWTTLRASLRTSGQTPAPAPATGFAATASLMTAVAWI
jgi:hypothetical protein